MDSFKFTIDLREYKKSAARLHSRHWPKVVVTGVSDAALKLQLRTQMHIAKVFDIKSNFIFDGVKVMPFDDRQKAAAQRMLLKRGIFDAYVYLRGAKDPKNSLQFIADHEYGRSRKAQDQQIAVPNEVKKYAFRTNKGKVRKRWKPGADLLMRYRETGSKLINGTTQSKKRKMKNRVPSDPFLIVGKGGKKIFVVRRLTREKYSLEYLYSFTSLVKIEKRMNFVETVTKNAITVVPEQLVKAINKLPNKL